MRFNLKSNYIFATVIVLIICAINYRWFSLGYFAYGDWHYSFNDLLRDSISPSVWAGSSGYGVQDASFWRLPLNLIIGLFASLGIPFNVSEKLLVFWPTVIGLAVSGYLLAYRIFQNKTAGVIGATVLSFNSYAIASIGQGHILLLTATFLAVLGFVFIMKAIRDGAGYKYFLFSSLLFAASGWVDLRVLYMSAIAVFLYSVFTAVIEKRGLKNLLPGLFLFGAVLLVANLFWLIPTIVSGGLSSSAVLSRGLFGNNFWNIYSAINFTHPFWGVLSTTWFLKQDVMLYQWILPVLFSISLILYRKNKPILIFFGILGVLGILLSKQVDAPFTGLYAWLFDVVPGFSAFRESTKFYFYSILGLLVLLSAFSIRTGLPEGKPVRALRYSALSAVLIIFSVNAYSIISGSVGKLYLEKQLPGDYAVFEEYVSEQPGFYRTLWTPAAARWNASSARIPTVTGPTLSNTWKQYLRDDGSTVSKNDDLLAELTSLLGSDYGQQILDYSSIRYVVVPLGASDNGEDLFDSYEGSRDDYIALLNSLDYLKQIDIGTNELVLYENPSYHSLVTLEDDVYVTDGSESPALLSRFFKATNGSSPSYVQQGDKVPASMLPAARSLFGSPSVSIADGGMVVSDNISSPEGTRGTLYRDTGTGKLYYYFDGSSVTMFSKTARLPQVNGSGIGSIIDGINVIKSVELDSQGSYYLRANEGIAELVEGSIQYVGSFSSMADVEIIKQGANSVENGSFEAGAWRDTVADCNKYDEGGDIAMSISSDVSSTGSRSLRLEAKRHTACTYTTIDVRGDEDYLLQLEYRSMGAQYSGYYLEFDDAEKTSISGRKLITDGREWNTETVELRSPVGATSAKLYLYAYESNGIDNNIVLYDNISLSVPESTGRVDLSDMATEFEKIQINLRKGSNSFDVNFPEYSGDSIIENGSFEEGAWTDRVGDCNNYDNNPSISMDLSSEASDGNKSLSLSARRHNACTSKSISFDAAESLLLSFDYKTNNKNRFGYYMIFDDSAKTTIKDFITKERPNQWGQYKKAIQVPFGSTKAELYLYAYESDGRTDNRVLFDNFEIIEIPDVHGRYFLVEDSSRDMSTPAHVSVSSDSSSKKSVYINGQRDASILTLSQSFDPGWRLYIEPIAGWTDCAQESTVRRAITDNTDYVECYSGKSAGLLDVSYVTNENYLPDEFHIVSNGFANGWLFDPEYIKANFPQEYWEENDDGGINVRLTLYYQPQSLFYLGVIGTLGISLISLIFFACYKLRNRKLHNRKPQAGNLSIRRRLS